MPWNEEQSEFLNKFYQGVVDPDTKLSMLCTELGREVGNFYGTKLNRSGTGLTGISDSEIPAATKIACIESELLIRERLYVPDYC